MSISCRNGYHGKCLPSMLCHCPRASAVDRRRSSPSWPSAVCYWVSMVLGRLCSDPVCGEWERKSQRLRVSKSRSCDINEREAEPRCVQTSLTLHVAQSLNLRTQGSIPEVTDCKELFLSRWVMRRFSVASHGNAISFCISFGPVSRQHPSLTPARPYFSSLATPFVIPIPPSLLHSHCLLQPAS